eukprot:SAG31_NODE_43_length_31224_cov_10.112578_13_plen_543_part_00
MYKCVHCSASRTLGLSLLTVLLLSLTRTGQSQQSEPVESHCPGTWSQWSNCSRACGPGMQMRQFTVNVSDMQSPQLCITFNGTAESRTCNLANCSVDCEGQWSDWGRCNATCGGGSRSRVYSVLRAAAYGGNESSCMGTANETEDQLCNMHNCSDTVDCLGEWGQWERCAPECGEGNQTRRYTVIHYGANNGTNATCETTVDGAEQMQSCSREPCPVDCVGSWGNFSNCSVACGLGFATRRYTVHAAEMHGGADYTCGALNGTLQTVYCDAGECSPEPEPEPDISAEPVESHCPGTWSQWSNCSRACGPGMQMRQFTVNVSDMQSPQLCITFNGTAESRTCNLANCSVDCEGQWSDWGRCNATCGGGSRSRVYSVLRAAAYGGNESSCMGTANETEDQLCNMHNCSDTVDCLGEWGQWERCAPECGEGNQTRRYTVIHYGANNGTNATCETTVDGAEQMQSCSREPCPVDCVGSWGNFSNCSVACGLGFATRRYTVHAAEMHGGADYTCDALNGTLQTVYCDAGECSPEPEPEPGEMKGEWH